MKIAFFDTKPYDKPSFEAFAKEKNIKFKFFETKLNEDTVELARGYDGICVFVNDTVNAAVIDRLAEYGVKVIALRCAGFNNVDMKYAFGKIHVLRVPAYSPYAVAEHTMALLLTSIRRIHKAYIRSRDFNFSLSGLTGFDLHGKTVGVIGTGKIGRVFIDICRGFGMKVLAYDKFPAKDIEDGDNIKYVELDELFAVNRAKDDDGVRHCFRLKLFICGGILLISLLIFGIFRISLNRSRYSVWSTFKAGQRVGARHFLPLQRPAFSCLSQDGRRKFAVGPPTS